MRWILLLMLAACGGASPGDVDVVGPFTGPVHRFVVDDVTLPTTGDEGRAIGADLDGDGVVDNQLALVLNLLVQGDNLTTHGPEMIRAGVLASVVEIQADDLGADPTVGVTYLGREGDPATVLGGSLEGGAFVSNRTATGLALGAATLRLPAIADADPSVIVLDAMEAELTPDGQGGYVAVLRGGIDGDALRAETARGLRAMIVADPQGHPNAISLFDRDRDGEVTLEEIETNSLIVSLLEPDADLRVDGRAQRRLTAAIQVHLSPCPAGTCVDVPPAPTCFDRVQNGDETAVDCGGGCRACAGGAACEAPTDCQANACTTGVCAAPSCTDGVASGYETGVDCGWNCAGCPRGEVCNSDADCASGRCGGALTCL